VLNLNFADSGIAATSFNISDDKIRGIPKLHKFKMLNLTVVNFAYAALPQHPLT
jgi:hypothetical protein